MTDLLNLLRAALARIIQQPLPVMQIQRVVSFDDMARRFQCSYDVGIQGTTLFLRPVGEKKYVAQGNVLALFVKKYLIEQDLSHQFTRNLVNDFRDWLLIGSSVVRAEEKE